MGLENNVKKVHVSALISQSRTGFPTYQFHFNVEQETFCLVICRPNPRVTRLKLFWIILLNISNGSPFVCFIVSFRAHGCSWNWNFLFQVPWRSFSFIDIFSEFNQLAYANVENDEQSTQQNKREKEKRGMRRWLDDALVYFIFLNFTFESQRR